MPLEVDEEHLIELHRFAALGRMLANAAHEFSTPAAALASNAELELRLLGELEKVSGGGRPADLVAALRDLAVVNQTACARIREVVKGLKTAARARGAEFQRVDINEMVEALMQLVRTGSATSVRLDKDFGSVPAVECEPSLLAQALLNLLSNAYQAIAGSGTVTVRTRAEGGQAHIWIADTGCGIRDEDQTKVLRQSFTTKPVGAGTGLGLAIAGDVIQRVHGGTVEFESEFGKGSTFHVRIPVDHKNEGA
jgi:two-component system NtrC family sensor kinase